MVFGIFGGAGAGGEWVVTGFRERGFRGGAEGQMRGSGERKREG